MIVVIFVNVPSAGSRTSALRFVELCLGALACATFVLLVGPSSTGWASKITKQKTVIQLYAGIFTK